MPIEGSLAILEAMRTYRSTRTISQRCSWVAPRRRPWPPPDELSSYAPEAYRRPIASSRHHSFRGAAGVLGRWREPDRLLIARRCAHVAQGQSVFDECSSALSLSAVQGYHVFAD